jgi:hypothetical protein
MAKKSRDQVLLKMLKTKPQPKQAKANKKAKSKGAKIKRS